MAARQKDASGEALSRLLELDISELREEWRFLYKTDASPHLSRELLIRAVAYRMQEVALGGIVNLTGCGQRDAHREGRALMIMPL